MKSKKSYVEVNSLEELCKLMGLPQTEVPKIKFRSELVSAIISTMEKKKLTHAQAAKITGVGRTVITAVVNCNLDKISTDRLVDIALALGIKLTMKVA